MLAAHELLDLAKAHCEGRSYASIARRVGLTPQVIHMWKIGTAPLSAERVRQLCRIAGENPENWTIRILAEQSKGEEKKTWENVMKRLGIAAAVVLLVGAIAPPADATVLSAKHSIATSFQADLGIMRNHIWLDTLRAQASNPTIKGFPPWLRLART